jgi:hypothetical protein
MARQTLVELLYQSWADLDHAIEGLSVADAEAGHHGLSRIAWTVGHVGQQVDSWFNVRFAGEAPHPLLSQPRFHTGASGEAAPWNEVLAATREVRDLARGYLDGLSPDDMERVVPYTGGIDYLRPTGLKMSYALMRTATHHLEHTGEILTIRSLLGHEVDGSWVWGEGLL